MFIQVKTMHPFWIQKIEESRKTAVTTFWVTMLLIVILPLMLVLKGDAYLILAMCCFAGAAIRLYWKSDKQYVEFSEGARKEANAISEYRQKRSMENQPQQMFPEYQPAIPHPEMVDSEGNILTPQYLQMPEAENFFQVSMENGEPVVNPEEQEEMVPGYTQMDDMRLADPTTHPNQGRFQAQRKLQQPAPHIDAQL